MKILVIYDDTSRKSEVIEDIIGNKGFADVVVKKRRLEDFFKEEILKIYPDAIWKKVHASFEYSEVEKELEKLRGSEVKVLHVFSNYLISDADKAALSFRKLVYVDDAYAMLMNNQAVGGMFPDLFTYAEFVKSITTGQNPKELMKKLDESFEIEGIVDIGVIGNFIQCITGNFDSRYFNSLEGNEYTLVKSSVNKKKIKAEYEFYHLLPENMKYWFVMPFDYAETEDAASYTMERLHMTDLAIKWVHGSMDEEEFAALMDKYFYFFGCRHSKECSKEQYDAIAKDLYVSKVESRIADLEATEEYAQIQKLLGTTKGADLRALLDKYLTLKDKVEAKAKTKHCLTIGHGDPCFANALYNKSTKMLKFIDPKGVTKEEELWTNPYYDVAKLSHSVCGSYDFFNNALFELKVGTQLELALDIPFDNARYVEIFKRKVEENGFDYWSVRLYEASLFLSMLPLHIDNPQKVLGFILNAKRILEEIEKNV